MRIAVLGGLRVEHDGRAVTVTGTMQLAVLFRLAVDAGRVVSYREIVEDVWGLDAPENERAALQSVVSRLRGQLPAGAIESSAGGYRLVADEVDALRFTELAQRAIATGSPAIAAEALGLWTGEPWVPSENFDWFERDLRRDHAAVRALAEVPPSTSVPAPISELIGRGSELAAIRSQLDRGRLVTVLGPGGAGKTRLAVEVGRASVGVVFVELAPVGEGEVLAAVAGAAGRELRTEATESVAARDRLLDLLRARPTLLVLDNCEHLIGEVAALVADLLAAAPQLSVLTTSREPVGVPGEAFVPVGPLGLPTDDPGDSPAVQLFRERAIAATGTDFDDLDRAAAICRRLDGLPLAIELAAAKLRTMTADEVLTGLDQRFTLLTGGFRTALPRHQTLRAMIDWSWSLIGEDERRALAGMAVYPAGIAASSVAEVAATMGVRDAAVFDALVDRSLLQRVGGRFRALETIREYGIERLAESDGLAAAREGQARRIAATASVMDGCMRSARIHEAIAWFDAEEDNIAAALRYAMSLPMPEVAVQLVVACAWYWIVRNQEDEAETWFQAIGPMLPDVDGPNARTLEFVIPILERFGGGPGQELPEDDPEAIAEWGRNVPVYTGEHDVLALVPVLLQAFAPLVATEGWMLQVRIPHGEDLGLGAWPTAMLHVVAGAMAQNRGDVELLGLETALGIEQFAAIGDLWGLALSQQLRAEWLALQGRLEEALQVTDESTENMRRITPSWDLAQQQSLGVQLLVRLGRADDAIARAREMVESAERVGNGRTIVQARLTAASALVAIGDAAGARAMLDPIRAALAGFPRSPGQIEAMVASTDAGIAMLEGDLDAAEQLLRTAASHAIASHDQPIMGLVAVNAGTLALRRGDIRRALAAVDVAAVLVGVHDATHPQIAEIILAAAERGIGRDSAVLSRPMAIEELGRLT